jgi:hypothetical protein
METKAHTFQMEMKNHQSFHHIAPLALKAECVLG